MRTTPAPTADPVGFATLAKAALQPPRSSLSYARRYGLCRAGLQLTGTAIKDALAELESGRANDAKATLTRALATVEETLTYEAKS